jgi:hypothetical protein
MTKFSGVVRKFKPSESINPCLCTVTIYRKDYEARQKNKDGNWENIPQKASEFEKKLCSIIDNQKDQFIGEGLSFKGWLDFVPDDLTGNEPDIDLFDAHKTHYWNLEPFPSSGKYPKWEMTTFARELLLLTEAGNYPTS